MVSGHVTRLDMEQPTGFNGTQAPSMVDEDMVKPTPESSNDDTSTILQMYQMAVEMADRISARRAGANTFFLTLNTALAAVVGIVSSARKPPPLGNIPTFDAFGLVVTAISGIVLALVWWLLLRYYRRLNSAKFDVINTLELLLPVQPYTNEWAILHPGESMNDKNSRNPSRWKYLSKVKHREASLVEQVIPFVFMFIYLALGIRVLVQ